ncbi:hypothetical protein T484DRAFT_2157311 [Baffinella frigidus]|nr:hypothetical protein T484DRAFT_2157311 [Cryptophyta sp. CCMP2293]|mmetsp:Transcript_22607/g.54236  ORF Transcript_22607/g.54236 Transcript_22607/m.54236 type:complete len:193 (-) Transcript_22607:49-627(-)
MIKRSAAFLVGTHAVLAAASMGAGTFSPPRIPAPAAVEAANPRCLSCSAPAQLSKVAGKMYRGGGLDAAFLSPGVVFEDPAVCCVGTVEVQEAFRALHAASPESLEEPRLVVDGDNEGATAVFALRQRYVGFLQVDSTLHIHTAADGRISRFEERWNGTPLWKAAPFRWSRRLNGLLSSALTPLLVTGVPPS